NDETLMTLACSSILNVPTATSLSPLMATSAFRAGAPVPSMTIPPRSTTSAATLSPACASMEDIVTSRRPSTLDGTRHRPSRATRFDIKETPRNDGRSSRVFASKATERDDTALDGRCETMMTSGRLVFSITARQVPNILKGDRNAKEVNQPANCSRAPWFSGCGGGGLRASERDARADQRRAGI